MSMATDVVSAIPTNPIATPDDVIDERGNSSVNYCTQS
jgi:hypothetical protein